MTSSFLKGIRKYNASTCLKGKYLEDFGKQHEQLTQVFIVLIHVRGSCYIGVVSVERREKLDT